MNSTLIDGIGVINGEQQEGTSSQSSVDATAKQMNDTGNAPENGVPNLPRLTWILQFAQFTSNLSLKERSWRLPLRHDRLDEDFSGLKFV